MESAPTPLHPAFAKLTGTWKGTNKVYFGPDQPPVDTADITGEMKLVSGGRLLEFSYTTTFKGKSIDGKLIVSYDTKFEEYLMSWIDSFHNSNRILQLSSGRGSGLYDISAFGEYPADETVYWGWRIEVLPEGESGLSITHYNLPPGEDGVIAVVWDLERN